MLCATSDPRGGHDHTGKRSSWCPQIPNQALRGPDDTPWNTRRILRLYLRHLQRLHAPTSFLSLARTPCPSSQARANRRNSNRTCFRTIAPTICPPKPRTTQEPMFFCQERSTQHNVQRDIDACCGSQWSASGFVPASTQESFNNWNDFCRAFPRCLMASLWHLATVELPCLRTSSTVAVLSRPSRHHLAMTPSGD